MEFYAWIQVAFLLLFSPFSISFPLLLFLNRNADRVPIPPPVVGRRILVAITTYGEATDVVTKIIDRLRSYGLPAVSILVVVEERDRFDYGVPRVTVPAAYATPHGSQQKHRALHFFSRWLTGNGYGSETYVLHLDDDSIVPRHYLEYVLGMTAVAGQGALRLRHRGDHLLSTVADFGRAINCAAYCTFFNRRGRPLGVHGEGLVIRADVESTIGWDFQPVCAEDLLMGHTLVARGYRFDYIPGGIYIAPPTSARDFFQQRRRWMRGFFASFRTCWDLSRPTALWFAWLYLAGGTVLVGALVWLTIQVTFTPSSYALDGLSTINVGVSLLLYQWQASQTGKFRWNLIALLLFVPAGAYASFATFYYLLTPTPRRDIPIRKV